jgi:hypothetical protein
MKSLKRAYAGVFGFLSVLGLSPACGEMPPTPAIVETSKKKAVAGKDAAAMDKLMKEIKSGFGERNPELSSVSFKS